MTGIRIPSLATCSTNLFAGTNDGRVFRSTDNGTSWYPVFFTLVYETVTSFAVLGTSIFAGTRGGKLCAGGVYFSSNGGTNWVRTGGYGEYVCVYALAAIGTNLFYGGPYGISLSTDNGTSWTSVLWGSFDVYTFAVSGTNLFAGFSSRLPGTPGGVYLSTNNGSNWTEVSNGLVCSSVNALAVSGTNLYAGTYPSGVFLSTNDGTNWIAINNGLTDTTVNSLLASGTNLFAGTSSGVFLTTNNGNSWNAVNTGLSNARVLSLSVINSVLISGTAGCGVWSRPLSEMITDVEDSEQLPLEFALGQNFPNPFNPTTKIKYTIPNVIANEVKQSQLVTLKVYDILGNEVATLVNEEQPASTYEVEFNAANLPSGVYFYQLIAGEFISTKKMLLLK